VSSGNGRGQARPSQYVTGLGGRTHAIRVLLKQKALRDQRARRLLDGFDEARVFGVPLLQRPARIAGREALGPGLRKRNERAAQAAEIGAPEDGRSCVPSGRRADRDAHLQEQRAADVKPGFPIWIWYF